MNSFSYIPDINFAEKDADEIVNEIIQEFENKIERKLYPGDPLRLLILTFANFIIIQRNLIDFSAKQNLLKYAGEGYLENIAALYDVKRLEPSAAITTVRFHLSQPLNSATIIKEGTRVTAGDKVYFATVKTVEIPVGEIYIDVLARCTETGEKGNNMLPGQINVLSDPFPYCNKVENITMSQGGADIESIESLRERTRVAPESFSVAGPYGAYEFWAKTASQLIVDVSVTSPYPGVVEIIPLLENGELPTEDILEAVYKECNDDNRRPLTDMVTVRSPEKISYDIDLKYYISRKNSTIGLSIQNKVNEAVDNFISWQKTVLGRDINPSMLTEMLMHTGIKRVEIITPEFTRIKPHEIAIADNISLTYGGLEDD